MAVHSGKDGTATGVDGEVVKWSYETTTTVPKYNSASTEGWKKGVVGVSDGKGSIDVKCDGVPCATGDEISLSLDSGDGLTFAFPAIVSGVTIECDIDNGEIVSATVTFEQNGKAPTP
jgi:hypothetical protein